VGVFCGGERERGERRGERGRKGLWV